MTTPLLINTARFQFLRDSLEGSGPFAPGIAGALVRYPRESDDKYKARQKLAWYTRDLMSACARFAGHMGSRAVSRQVENPLLQLMSADCNWRGDTLDVFWSDFIIQAKARGSMLLLVDMPLNLPASQGEQIEQRAVPYLVPIKPEEVIEVEVDERGRVSFCEIRATWAPAPGATSFVEVVKGWDTAGWWVRRGSETLAAGEHGLDLCPVLAFAEVAFGHEGEFAQIADLSARLFNMRSELDEILRSQTFSLLTYPVPPEQMAQFDAAKAREVTETIGTSNMLVCFGDSPGFIAPPDGPASIYLQAIERMEALIRHIGHEIQAPGEKQAESGEALRIRYQALNAALALFARRMEDLERRVWDVACAWLRISNRVAVSWPREFQIADLQAELDAAQSLQALGAPPGWHRAKMKQLVTLSLGSGDEQALNDILREIDDAEQERPPANRNTTGEDDASQA